MRLQTGNRLESADGGPRSNVLFSTARCIPEALSTDTYMLSSGGYPSMPSCISELRLSIASIKFRRAAAAADDKCLRFNSSLRIIGVLEYTWSQMSEIIRDSSRADGMLRSIPAWNQQV